MSEFTEEEKEAAEKAEADAIAEQEASEAQAAEKAKAEKIDMEDVETNLIDIITTSPGTITGKGLVKAGTRHTIEKSAFSKEWMVHNAKTADGIMEIDPQHRYNVTLASMDSDELKILMVKVGIKTQKKTMKRADVERLITSRLIKIAEDEAAEE